MSFVRIANGTERWGGGTCIPRHRHASGYAAIVLSGSYEECGTRGRFRVGPGDVLLHSPFDAHLDRFGLMGAQILNLELGDDLGVGASFGRLADADALARHVASDPEEAALRLRDVLLPAIPSLKDWPDMLAAELIDNPSLCLGAWAEANGLAAETLSRGFRKVFGIPPAVFRAEVRTHRTFADIVSSDAPLALIAVARGFADQAHLTRAMRALTGAPPSAWRRSNRFKTSALTAA